MHLVLLFFFFSSRRRHTRYIGDWSSDVCSSDLSVCSACEGVIALGEVENKVFGPDGDALQFHRACYDVWQTEVAKPRRAIAGGSAGMPWTLLRDACVASRARYKKLLVLTAETQLAATQVRTRSARARTNGRTDRPSFRAQ